MPENDMGTAHGRVKITVEDRQLTLLADRLAKMQKSMDKMSKNMDKFAQALTGTEKASEKASKSYDKVARTQTKAGRSFVKSSKSVRSFSKDILDTTEDVVKLVNGLNKMRHTLAPLEKFARILTQFDRAGGGISGFAQALGNVNREAGQLARTVDGLTNQWNRHNKALQGLRGGLIAGAAGFSIFWNQGILGKNRAISQMPVIAQNMNKMTQMMRLFGTVAPIAAAAAAGPWAIGLAKAAAANQKFHSGISNVLGRLDAFDSRFSIVTNRVRSFVTTMDRAGNTVNDKSRVIGRAFRDIYNGANGFPKAAQQVLTGVALMNSGVKGLIGRFAWMGKIPKLILAPLIAAIGAAPAALELLGKALSGVSNILVGLLNGIQQLSGGLLALPGIIATVVAGGATVFALFKGLSDKFSDIFKAKDFEEMAEALSALPPHLRGLGKLAVEVKKRFEDFQTVLQERFFEGFEQQLRPLIDAWLPRMQTNMLQVTSSLRGLKDAFVQFLGQAETGRDVNSLYSHTAQILNNVTQATQPLLNGFRDLGTVGSAFASSMSGFLPVLTRSFENWAKVNRDNGNLAKWMNQSVDGARDLVMGLVDVTKAAWTLLTIFKTNDGGNFLERFAAWAERLDERVKKSAATGFLRELGDGVRNLGLEKFADLKELFGQVVDMLQQVIPFVHDITQAFSQTFLPVLEWAMQDIKNFTNLLDAMGLDSIIGWILGLVAAFKLIPEVLGPVRNALQIAWGGIMLFRNTGKIMSAVDTALLSTMVALDNFGGAGKKASKALSNFEGGAKRLITGFLTMIPVIGTLAAAIGGLALMWKSNNDYVSAGFKQIDENILKTAKHVKDMKNAFAEDNGFVGKNVIAQVQTGLDDMMVQLEETAQKAPSVWDNISNALAGNGKNRNQVATFTQSDEFNYLQKVTADAGRASTMLKQLQSSGIDLNKVIRMSDEEYASFARTMLIGKENGNEANEALMQQRNILKGLEQDFKNLGTGGIQLSEGIKTIAEAADDTTSKLEGLKQVLIGLGILKVDRNDALFAYAEGIKELGEKAAELRGLDFGKFLNADGTDWNQNAAELTEGAITLRNMLNSLGSEFMAVAASGGDTTQAYANFEAQLQNLSTQTGISVEDLKMLAAQEGLVPKETTIALSVQNKPQVIQDLAEVYLAAEQKLGQGVKIPVQVDNPEEFQRRLDALLGRDVAYAEGSNLMIKPGLSQTDMNKIAQELTKFGVEVPGVTSVPQPLPQKIQPKLGTNENGVPIQGPVAIDPEAGKQQAGSAIDEIIGEISGKIDSAKDGNRESGNAFTSDFAQGILDKKSDVERAADEVAQAARDRMPGSPAKKGPLSGSGWSGVAGQSFSSDFGWGIRAKAGDAASAAGDMAGGVRTALGNGQGVEAAGEFLGQLSRLVDFGARFAEVMGKVAESVFGIAKFVSDPMGKGTFFGQRMGFRRDPNVSQEALDRRRADAAQNRISSMIGSGRRDTSWYDPRTGGQKVNLGDLGPNPERQSIANYIIDKAMSEGYSRQQANEFLIQAVGESNGLDPKAENPNGWFGIFQFDKSTWEQAGGGKMTDAKNNIDNYFKLAEQRGLTPQNFTSGSQLGTQVSIGGPWHPENAAKGHLDNATANAQKFIDAYQSGVGQSSSAGAIPGIPSMPGNLDGSKLRSGEGVDAGLEPEAAMVAALLSNMFPGITDIGGKQNRPAGSPQMHTNGRALDVMTGGDAALGDAIAEFVKNNYSSLGIQSYIWRDQGLNLVSNEGGGPGTTYTAGGHGGPSGTQSGSHVHIQFADGGKLDIGPNGSNLRVPTNLADRFDSSNFGLPMAPEDTPPKPEEIATRNPDVTLTPIHQGTGNVPGEKLNPLTGKPWTLEESQAFWNDPRNAVRYDQSGLKPGDTSIPGVENKSQEEMLKELQTQTPLLQESLDVAKNPDSSDNERAQALSTIQAEIDRQTAIDTPASRLKAQGLESAKSDAMQEFGFTEQQNPIDQAAGIASSMASVAGDVFKVMDSVIQSIGATKDLADMAIRGPSSTEDIYNMIDRFQKYIQLGADIAGAVSSISGAIGGIAGAAGGADPSGGASGAAAALGAVSQIAGLIQSAFETVNAVIDLGQEAYRIIGSYVGDFLGFLVGGPAGKLEGDVKFLLDEVNGNLMAYSRDNPQDKREHALPGQEQNPDARNQAIGQINVIGGYGQDPRDLTRQMMWQVNTAQFAGVGNG